MTKELEAFEELKRQVGNMPYTSYDNGLGNRTTFLIKDSAIFPIIENALKRLESYEFMFRSCELSMSKEKEALQRTDSFRLGYDVRFNKSGYSFEDYHKDMETLRQSLNTLQTLRLFYREDTDKKLKALEIIKKKEVNVEIFNSCPNLYEYNNWATQLTQEEYDLLKEVLL